MASLYETDFSAWAVETAQLLAQRRFEEIELDALIEEVEELSGSQKEAIESYLYQLLFHLLKIMLAGEHDHDRAGKGWRRSVREPRRRIARLIRKSPSLRSYPSKVIAEEYTAARIDALDELELSDDTLPLECLWMIEQVLDDDFWPDREGTE